MSLKKLGRYELIRVLGQGAMGVVYEGRDPRLGRRVAIKTVQSKHLSQESTDAYEARFRTEARSAARLQHPHIVSVYDCARDGDTAFLVMEYIDGQDLKQRLDAGGRFTLAQSLRIGHELLSALAYAHRQGIIHRDIKPANLLIEQGGRLKLADFGVARIMDSPEGTRTEGALVGTLKYMAPEQVQGKPVDPRADLFAVGVVLYQLVTGVRPFEADNDYSVMQQVVSRVPLRPSALNPKLPRALDSVLTRALAKDPSERFATAEEFADALVPVWAATADSTAPFPASPQGTSGGTRNDAASGVVVGSHVEGSVAASPSAGARPAPCSPAIAPDDEMACWKELDDVRDAREIEGFLARFPAARHADLAQRRLRMWGAQAQAALTGEQTSTWPTWDGLPRRQGPRWRVVAGGCALLLAALVGLGWTVRQPTPTLLAATTPAPLKPSTRAALVETKTPSVKIDPAPLATLGAGPSPMTETATATPTAPQPARPAIAMSDAAASPAAHTVASKPAQGPSAGVLVAVESAVRPPALDRDERVQPRARAVTASRGNAAPSRKPRASSRRLMAQDASVCSDRVLFARQMCLQRECAKPAFDQAQACVMFRQHARLREESRLYN